MFVMRESIKDNFPMCGAGCMPSSHSVNLYSCGKSLKTWNGNGKNVNDIADCACMYHSYPLSLSNNIIR